MYKKIILPAIAVLLVLAVIIVGGEILNTPKEYGTVSYDAIDVSLINLIANPQEYDGKTVRVYGVANMEFEGTALYFSKEDYKHGLSRNAIWLSIDSELWENEYHNLQKFNGKYVLVEGTFVAEGQGHMSMYSAGTIKNINRLNLWK